MTKQVNIQGVSYTVVDDEFIGLNEDLVFEIKPDRNEETTLHVIGKWNDMLGSPIKKVWKIVKTED
jgi:hypothetical protein